MRRNVVGVVVVLAAASVAGCGGDDESQPRPTDYVADPADTADDALYAFTATITITETGFQPVQATAVFGETLTFVNETDRAQTITFTNGSPHLDGPSTFGPIAPAASLSVPEPLETMASLVYESDGLPGTTGRLQIDQGTDEL